MMVRKSELGEMASDLLGFLDKEGINLRKDLDERIKLDRKPRKTRKGNRVLIETNNSNGCTEAYVIDYIVEGAGIPIEIRLNYELDYNLYMIKCTKKIERYEHFCLDLFDNIVQTRKLPQAGLPNAKEELGRFSGL